MAEAFRVNVPFERADPLNPEASIFFDKGSLVVRPDLVALIRDGEHGAHGHIVTLPDDHHAVIPHLPLRHPARVEYMKARGVVEEETPALPAVVDKRTDTVEPHASAEAETHPE